MQTKIIGFVGLDVQDTILYLSRVFYQMGKKLLMVDYSESQALYYSIPVIPGMDTYRSVIEYRGTYFTCGPVQLDECKEYDVIMIFFGFEARREMKYCSHLIYTTDGERNHMEKISNMYGADAEYRQLVYRNSGKNREVQGELWETMCPHHIVKEECRYHCNDRAKDRELRVMCQYNEVFGFRGLSQNFCNYLKKTIRAVFPEEASGKRFEDCFKRAQMGG